jgi:hypothetical protein
MSRSTHIHIWESASDWGDCSDDEREALDRKYEDDCMDLLSDAFPESQIHHVISYDISGDLRVTGADPEDVREILIAVYESVCSLTDAQVWALIHSNIQS